jgi:hypothetical protein
MICSKIFIKYKDEVRTESLWLYRSIFQLQGKNITSPGVLENHVQSETQIKKQDGNS